MTTGMNRRDLVLLAGSAGLAAMPSDASLSDGSGKPTAQMRIHARDPPMRSSSPTRVGVFGSTARRRGKTIRSTCRMTSTSPRFRAIRRAAAGMYSRGEQGSAIALPATVEQYYWGKFGTRPYTIHEYAWAPTDPVPQNGAYRVRLLGWWREIEIPADFRGRRILLSIRGARACVAEVFLNRKLVGYSIMEELPFHCDVTEAAEPGGEENHARDPHHQSGRALRLDRRRYDGMGQGQDSAVARIWRPRSRLVAERASAGWPYRGALGVEHAQGIDGRRLREARSGRSA